MRDDTEPGIGDEHGAIWLSPSALADMVARYNEGVIATIDAIDTALIGIVALPAAFAVFAVDKIRELPPAIERAAVALLLASVSSGFVGYGWGVFIGTRNSAVREGFFPARFLSEYVLDEEEAVINAVGTLIIAGKQNAAVRRIKRTYAVVALVLFSGGVAAILFGRFGVIPRSHMMW